MLVTAKEAAAHFKVCSDFIYRKAKSGDLPSYKLGRSIRFKLEELEEFIKAKRDEHGKKRDDSKLIEGTTKSAKGD